MSRDRTIPAKADIPMLAIQLARSANCFPKPEICRALDILMQEVKAARNTVKQRAIKRTQKAHGCRGSRNFLKDKSSKMFKGYEPYTDHAFAYIWVRNYE